MCHKEQLIRGQIENLLAFTYQGVLFVIAQVFLNTIYNSANNVMNKNPLVNMFFATFQFVLRGIHQSRNR